MNRTTLTFITALAMSALVGMAVLVAPSHEIKAQLTDNNAIARYTQGLESKLNLCQDNPFRSHDIPAIIIQGNIPGKNGGITAYGNANATGHGKNGAISIGGDYNDKSNSATPYNGNLGSRGGNGGIAFCGSANGQNITGG
ncbi:MAG: hypothetical protein WA667_26450 [Candidatus Nitrosopolaris sp.]